MIKFIISAMAIVFLFNSCGSDQKNEDTQKNQVVEDSIDFNTFAVFNKKRIIKNLNNEELIAYEVGYVEFVKKFLNFQYNYKYDKDIAKVAETNYDGLQRYYLEKITNKKNYELFKIEYHTLEKYGIKLYLITWNTFTENILIAIDSESNYFTLFGFETNQSETLINYTLNNNKSENRKRDSIILHNLFNYNARSILPL